MTEVRSRLPYVWCNRGIGDFVVWINATLARAQGRGQQGLANGDAMAIKMITEYANFPAFKFSLVLEHFHV